MPDWLTQSEWATRLWHVAVAVLVGLAATWVARVLVRRFERHVAGGLSDEARRKRAKTLSTLMRATATVVIWTVVLISAMQVLGVPVGPLLAAAGIGGIALGFGAQTLVRDVVAGFNILLEHQYDVGDEVALGDVEGTVEAISLRTTAVRGLDGARHVVANGEVRVSTNRTRLYSRYLLVLPLPYTQDIDAAVEVARAAAAELREDPDLGPDILGDLRVLGVDAFGERSVDVKMYIETRPGRQHAVGRELRRRIKLAMDREGIVMPHLTTPDS